MKQSKRARKGDKKTLDDDSLVLEEENEDKPTIVARFVQNSYMLKNMIILFKLEMMKETRSYYAK